MKEFHLSRKGFEYELVCQGQLITIQRFNDETLAMEYFSNFITSWFCSTLIVNFEQLPTKLKMGV